VAIGAGGDKIAMTEPAEYSKSLDWINIMSYDFHGGWEATGPTDFQAPLYNDPDSPNSKAGGYGPTYNIDGAVKALLAAGAPANKLVVGIPIYGRGWTGVAAGPKGDGLFQKATSPAPGKYESGIQDYKLLKSAAGTVYESSVAKTAYKFDGKVWWSYDTPNTVKLKTDYIKAQNLRGGFAWELDGDGPNAELMKVLSDGLK
jgi:chitinase